MVDQKKAEKTYVRRNKMDKKITHQEDVLNEEKEIHEDSTKGTETMKKKAEKTYVRRNKMDKKITHQEDVLNEEKEIHEDSTKGTETMKKKAEKTYVRRNEMEREGNNQVDEKETQKEDVHNEEKEILNEDSSITRSYKLIQGPVVSYKDPLVASVLNSECVLAISSGSIYKRSNPYEDKLNTCEDQRFELDMLLEYGNSVTKNVNQLLEKFKSSENKPICLEDHLTAQNFRFIEMLYGDEGIEVVENIKSDPWFALPCVMKRVKQRQEEWKTCLSEFEEPWAEVYAKNFHKALDHKTYDKEKSKESDKSKSKAKNKSKEKGKAEAEIKEKNKSKEKVESHEDEKDRVIRKSARKIKPNQKYL